MDDLDMMLCHEDFPHLLNLASHVKSLHFQGVVPIQQHASKDGPLDPSEVISAVTRMHERLLSSSSCASHPPRILRGSYPMIDSLLDDSFGILQREVERCRSMAVSTPISQPHLPPSSGKKIKSTSKEVIAIKYSKWQTDILMQWMMDNLDNPFPDRDDVHELMQKTNLSYSQIINWTTNVRKRNRKATCQDGKKPHHFIDFLFLAEKRESEATPNKSYDSMLRDATLSTPSRSASKKSGQSSVSSLSNKKRKVGSMLDYDSELPSLSSSAPYYATSPVPEDGTAMAFPTTPAYHYSHSPHRYHQHDSYTRAHPGAYLSPPYSYSPHAMPYLGYAHTQTSPQIHRYSPKDPNVRPTTPPPMDSDLPPIREESSPLPSPVISKAKIDPGIANIKVKIELPSPVPSSDVKIKQEGGTMLDVIPPSFDNGTEMDPIKIDEPSDASLLEDFAVYWEFQIDDSKSEFCHSADSNKRGSRQNRGRAVYVLRETEAFTSPDVSTLMEDHIRLRQGNHQRERCLPNVVSSDDQFQPSSRNHTNSGPPSKRHHPGRRHRYNTSDPNEMEVCSLESEFDGAVGV